MSETLKRSTSCSFLFTIILVESEGSISENRHDENRDDGSFSNITLTVARRSFRKALENKI